MGSTLELPEIRAEKHQVALKRNAIVVESYGRDTSSWRSLEAASAPA
jgi:hypothetical protein